MAPKKNVSKTVAKRPASSSSAMVAMAKDVKEEAEVCLVICWSVRDKVTNAVSKQKQSCAWWYVEV